MYKNIWQAQGQNRTLQVKQSETTAHATYVDGCVDDLLVWVVQEQNYAWQTCFVLQADAIGVSRCDQWNIQEKQYVQEKQYMITKFRC